MEPWFNEANENMRLLSQILLTAALLPCLAVADEGADGDTKPGLRATATRDDTRVAIASDGDRTIIDVTSRFGIDRATVQRQGEAWPKALVVRLHLRGLESFRAGNGDVEVEWSIASTGDHSARVALRKGKSETALDPKSPYHTAARIVGGNGKVPLKDGYFEVPLPDRLFEQNPEQITLRWVDFFRG